MLADQLNVKFIKEVLLNKADLLLVVSVHQRTQIQIIKEHKFITDSKI